MTDVAASPLRVVLIGCGRVGMHLIERFSVNGPFRVVAVCDDSCAGDLIAPFGVRSMSLQQIAQSQDIDVLWITSFWGFPWESPLSEVFRGHHLITEAPFALGNQSAERAFADAAQRGRLLLVHHPRRADPDFRQALAVAHDEKIGAIRAAKFVLWSYGRPPRGATRGIQQPIRDEYAEPGATKVRFVAHALDQLVQLVRSRPIRVAAIVDPGFADLFSGDSLLLRIVFESGCLAEIDIRLDSPTPFQIGWTLTSERGGYANGRRYTLTDDGEVFDSPVTISGQNVEADPIDCLAREIRSGVPNASEKVYACAVVALLEGAQQSLVTRQEVTLDWPSEG